MNLTKKILISAGCAVIAGAAVSFTQLLMLPILALAAYMGAVWGAVYMLPTLVLLCAGMSIGRGLDAGSAALLLSLLASAGLLYFGEKRSLPHRTILLGLAVLLCIGSYLSMALEPILAGEPPYQGAVAAWDEMTNSFASAVGDPLISEALGAVGDIIPDTLMWACILSSEAYAIGLLMLFRLCHRIFGTKARPMAELADWRLPDSAIPGGILMLLGIILVYVFKLKQANSIAYSLGLMIASLFAVQGMAYFMFIFRTTSAPTYMRVLLWAFTVLFFPYSLGLLAFFGIKEQLFPKRAKIKKLLKEREVRERAYNEASELEKYGYVRKPRNDPEDDNDKTTGEEADNHE